MINLKDFILESWYTFSCTSSTAVSSTDARPVTRTVTWCCRRPTEPPPTPTTTPRNVNRNWRLLVSFLYYYSREQLLVSLIILKNNCQYHGNKRSLPQRMDQSLTKCCDQDRVDEGFKPIHCRLFLFSFHFFDEFFDLLQLLKSGFFMSKSMHNQILGRSLK